MKLLLCYLIGLVFGLGIAFSGMANPAKVLNFFDVFGAWDPSLAFVMGGALVVTFVGYRLVLRRPAPVLSATFSIPTNKKLDTPLIAGAVSFGVGWGGTGFCPGAAIPALGTANVDVFLFMLALMVGVFTAKIMRKVLFGAGLVMSNSRKVSS